MTSAEVTALASALEVDPGTVAILDGYTPAEAAPLVAAVTRAVAADSESVKESIEKALRLVPWPIRGQARKLATGSRRG